jgi:hypothetical protein
MVMKRGIEDVPWTLCVERLWRSCAIGGDACVPVVLRWADVKITL